jgi:hypothetical protein
MVDSLAEDEAVLDYAGMLLERAGDPFALMRDTVPDDDEAYPEPGQAADANLEDDWPSEDDREDLERLERVADDDLMADRMAEEPPTPRSCG